MKNLRDGEIIFSDENQTLLEIAKNNNLSPKDIFSILQPESKRPQGMLPEEPPAGLGKKPLAELCREYSLDLDEVLRILADRNMTAKAEMNIQEIAEVTGKDPYGVYDLIRNELSKKSPSQ